MEAFLYSMAATFISLLGVMAYKHHKAFSALAPYFLGLITLYLYGGLVWNLGVSSGARTVRDAIRALDADTVMQTKLWDAEDASILPVVYWIVPSMVAYAYIFTLWLLPAILALGDSKEQKPENEDTEAKQ